MYMFIYMYMYMYEKYMYMFSYMYMFICMYICMRNGTTKLFHTLNFFLQNLVYIVRIIIYLVVANSVIT